MSHNKTKISIKTLIAASQCETFCFWWCCRENFLNLWSCTWATFFEKNFFTIWTCVDTHQPTNVTPIYHEEFPNCYRQIRITGFYMPRSRIFLIYSMDFSKMSSGIRSFFSFFSSGFKYKRVWVNVALAILVFVLNFSSIVPTKFPVVWMLILGCYCWMTQIDSFPCLLRSVFIHFSFLLYNRDITKTIVSIHA